MPPLRAELPNGKPHAAVVDSPPAPPRGENSPEPVSPAMAQLAEMCRERGLAVTGRPLHQQPEPTKTEPPDGHGQVAPAPAAAPAPRQTDGAGQHLPRSAPSSTEAPAGPSAADLALVHQKVAARSASAAPSRHPGKYARQLADLRAHFG